MIVWLLLISAADPAYSALRRGNLDEAVAWFRLAVWQQPQNAQWRKDLAYTLLRTGNREEARDHFASAVKQDPGDERTALEYAFLCYETRQPVVARRVFLQLTQARDAEVRRVAQTALENVEAPLRAGVTRWLVALERSSGQWSGHEELARLAEQLDDVDLAATHYEQAWQLRPDKADLLLDLARTWTTAGKEERARAALVTAWRSNEPRVAETARERLGGAIPGPDEAALERPAPIAGTDRLVTDAKQMGLRSLEQSYLLDARRFLSMAGQQDSRDAEVQYQLGVVANLLGHDREAKEWFAKARINGRGEWARKADGAYQRLAAASQRFGVSGWAVPFYSSRWSDMFVFSQVRAEWRATKTITPFVSLRFVGNAGGRQNVPWAYAPQYVSETSFITGVGVQWQIRYNIFAWGEVGQSFSYMGRRADYGLSRPDYRGGVSWIKGWGTLLGSSEPGWFVETSFDPIYASRFRHNLFFYSQSHAGYTFRPNATLGQWQAMAHANVTFDTNREYWSNTVEAGAGLRGKLPNLPKGMTLRAELLRGANTLNYGNPLRPNYWDLRIGVWYAFRR